MEAALQRLVVGQARIEEAIAGFRSELRQTNVTLAALGNNVGFSLEELAPIVVPDVLARQEGIVDLRLERRFVRSAEGEEELDLYGEGNRQGSPVTVIGEVKSRIYRREVERFGEKADRVASTLRGPVVPFMFGFVVHPSAEQAGDSLGIRVVAWRPSSRG